MNNTKTGTLRKLFFQSLPEMWNFQIITALAMTIPVFIVKELIRLVINSSGTAFTSANFTDYVFSWRFLAFLLLGILLIIIFIIMELFAQIFLSDDLLTGSKVKVTDELRKSVQSAPSLRTPAGLFIMLFIFLAVPLCGIGFSISLTRTLYIPNFIMDVIEATPLYAVLYTVVILLLVIMGFRYSFCLHAILLDKQKPAEALKTSKAIVRKNRKAFLTEMLKDAAVVVLITAAAFLIFRTLPENLLTKASSAFPQNYKIDPDLLFAGSLTGTDAGIVFYRFLCSLTVLMGGYLLSLTGLFLFSYMMLKLTKLYKEFTSAPLPEYPDHREKTHYSLKTVQMVLAFILVIAVSGVTAVFYNPLFDRETPAGIIAHRAGGTLASENSLEGLHAAIEHGCYGSEIDVQRTKDNFYIINHDSTFARLTGVDKAPGEMTLAEIMELRISDTTGNGNTLKVASFEEMLDVIKGKEKLFIELKGVSADQKTADDLITIIKNKNCENDVIFISLDYDVINYIETNYPEYETGTLFFIGLGDLSKLNCDLLIMEEEIATDTRIDAIHRSGKKAGVWTVNTPEGMYRFLDSKIDMIITDEITLAETTQFQLDNRTDLEVIQDKFRNFWD